jgi:hypothetical protein
MLYEWMPYRQRNVGNTKNKGWNHEKNACKFDNGGTGGCWVHDGSGSRSSGQGDEKNQN